MSLNLYPAEECQRRYAVHQCRSLRDKGCILVNLNINPTTYINTYKSQVFDRAKLMNSSCQMCLDTHHHPSLSFSLLLPTTLFPHSQLHQIINVCSQNLEYFIAQLEKQQQYLSAFL